MRIAAVADDGQRFKPLLEVEAAGKAHHEHFNGIYQPDMDLNFSKSEITQNAALRQLPKMQFLATSVNYVPNKLNLKAIRQLGNFEFLRRVARQKIQL